MRDNKDELYSNKSNQMIQNYAWSLKEKQLKIMELLCSCYMTNYYDEASNTVTVGLSDFMRELGSTTKGVNSKEYKLFRDTLKKLSDYSIIGIGFNGRERLIRMINTFEFLPETNQIKCFMSDDYRESMRQQPLGNTRIEFRTICNMDSRYSIKLYNLLRSWQGKEEVYFDLNYLKELLNVTAKSYDNFAKFRQAVLDVAVKEINEKTQLQISYEGLTPKSGHSSKITKVVFQIKNTKVTQKEELPKIPSIGIIGEPVELTDFERDLFDVIPEEVHKGDLARVRGVLDVAQSYIAPADFTSFLELGEFDDDEARQRKINQAMQAAEEDDQNRILDAIAAYVIRDYKTRKASIQNPNGYYNYFLAGFEGWLKSPTRRFR